MALLSGSLVGDKPEEKDVLCSGDPLESVSCFLVDSY